MNHVWPTGAPHPRKQIRSLLEAFLFLVGVGLPLRAAERMPLNETATDLFFEHSFLSVSTWLWQGVLALLVCLALFAFWNYSLRRVVAAQTKLMRERMEREAALELRCAELVENAADMVYQHDLQGNFTAVNPAAERLFGYSREEALRLNISQVVAPEYLETVRRQTSEKLSGGRPTTYEMEVLTKGGARIWLEVTSILLRREHESPQIQGIARDITERKRAEAALRASEHRFRALIEHGHDGLTLVDGKGIILYDSPSVKRILGYSPEERIGRAVLEFVHPDERMTLETAFAEFAGKPGAVGCAQHRFMRKDGAVVWLESVRTNLLDEPTVQAVVVNFRDITERQLAEAALRNERDFSEAMLNSMPGIFYMFDENGRYLKWNRNLEQVSGYTSEEIASMNPIDFFAGTDRARIADRISQVFTQGSAESEADLIAKDGSLHPYLFTGLKYQTEGRPCLIGVGIDLSARRKAEAEVARERNLLRAVTDNLPDYIYVKDTQGLYLFANAAHAPMFGLSDSGQMIGKTVADFFPPEIAHRLHQDDLRVIRSGEPLLNREEAVVDHAGHRRWVLTTKVPLRNSAGEITGLIGISRDVTERRQVLQALQQSEARLAEAQRIGRLGSWEMELVDGFPLPAFRGLHWSDEVFRLFGFERGQIEVSNERFFQMVPDQDRPRIQAAVAEAVRTGNSYQLDHRIITKEGHERVVHERAEVIRDPTTGRPLKLVGTVQDVTETKLAEEALRRRIELQDQLTKIAASVPGVICSFRLRPDGTASMPYASPQFHELYGLTPSEVEHDFSSAFALHHPDDLGHVRASIAESARTLQPWRDEFRIRHPQKGEIWIEGQSVPQREPDGSTLWHGFVQDITERKKSEETRVRLEAELRQAQKMEAVGQLAGGVAHDFNNLLTVIIGNAGMLGEEPNLSSVAAELNRQILAAADRAATLTRQLLAFSRRQVMQIRPLDLNDVLSNISKMLRRLLGEHISLQCNYASELSEVRADAGMLEQVVVNLAVNARDAMPRGGRLILSTRSELLGGECTQHNPEARAGRFVVLTVQDNGCGMDEATRARIFEPFFTTKGVGKGTGLGLATAYGIIKQHDGWIEVSSELGVGTSFKVYLPARPESLPAAKSKDVARARPAGTETILLVEDDPLVLELARACLRRFGYQVLEATHGTEALRVWEQNRGQIDLLLTDMVMPEGMGGLDLAARLRQSKPDLKVIFSSGYSTEMLDSDSPLPPGDAFLSKPYDLAALAQAVRKRLDSPVQ